MSKQTAVDKLHVKGISIELFPIFDVCVNEIKIGEIWEEEGDWWGGMLMEYVDYEGYCFEGVFRSRQRDRVINNIVSLAIKRQVIDREGNRS